MPDAPQVVIINYVPGWAFFWMSAFVLMATGFALVGLLSVLGHIRNVDPSALLKLMVPLNLLGIYILFTIALPMIGYTWSFCWVYMDRVAQAKPSNTAPFDQHVSQALGSAFSDLVYTCIPCIFSTLIGWIVLTCVVANNGHIDTTML